jgi:hypothetical protein
MAEAPLTGTVAVEGIAAVLQALGSIDKGLRTQLRGELRQVADHCAQFAIYIAEQNGLHESGDLIASIKGGARSSYAYITATARRVSKSYPQGFNYPAVYEYGGSTTRRAHGADWMIRNRTATGVRLVAKYGRGTGHLGARAFLEPAAQQGEPLLEKDTEALLDRLIADAGLQPA